MLGQGYKINIQFLSLSFYFHTFVHTTFQFEIKICLLSLWRLSQRFNLSIYGQGSVPFSGILPILSQIHKMPLHCCGQQNERLVAVGDLLSSAFLLFLFVVTVVFFCCALRTQNTSQLLLGFDKYCLPVQMTTLAFSYHATTVMSDRISIHSFHILLYQIRVNICL